jgi:hypothetical protein
VRIHIDTVPEDMFISSGMTCAVVVTAPRRPSAISELFRDSATAIRRVASL